MDVHEVRCRFPPVPESVSGARAFYREAVGDRLDPTAKEELALAVSELASNAIRHAQTDFDVVVHLDGFVRVGVEDGSAQLPVHTERAPGEGGMGLPILDAVCDTWGVSVVDGVKCVWCERRLPVTEPLPDPVGDRPIPL